MGMNWIRQAEIVERTTREATDLISAKLLSANDDNFLVAQAA